MISKRGGGGGAILRVVPLPQSGPLPTLDPFLFCVYHYDRYPSDPSEGKMEFLTRGDGHDFAPSAPYRMYHGSHVPGFPQHPHRGFETITATMEGVIDHADSVGNAGRYGEGDVQWMTAGKGIVHGEMFPLVHRHKPNPLRFFQIWLNLPRHNKMVDPSFAMFWSPHVPVWTSDDALVSVTVWAGNYFLNQDTITPQTKDGTNNNNNPPPPNSWASDPNNDVAVLRIVLQPGGTLILPKANKASTTGGGEGKTTDEDDNKDGVLINRTLYLVEGSHNEGMRIDGRIIQDKVCITLDATKDVRLELGSATEGGKDAVRPTEFLLLQGKPIQEPVVQHGPFVMNTQHEIQQAFMDYRTTQFGGWPWSRDDMIFPQQKGRFALIDGTESYPPPEPAAMTATMTTTISVESDNDNDNDNAIKNSTCANSDEIL